MTSTSPKKPRKTIPKGSLLGLGNPLLDVCAVVPLSLLAKYDLKSNDAILAQEKHLPLYEELVKDFKVTYVAGGATQNSIRVAQWMAQTPNATAYVGSVGKKCKYADILKKAAQSDGVETLYYEAEGQVTGTCAVLIHENDRSLVANLAAANHFAFEHVKEPSVADAIARARVFYSAGFFLTVPTGPATSKYIAEHAIAHDKIYSLNIAAPFIAQFFTDPLMELIEYADYVFGNESEAQALSDKLGWTTPSKDSSVAFDVSAAALRVAGLPKKSTKRSRIVVFTQGAESTIVAENGKIREFPVTRVPKESIVDTNGAGDAFVGGFLSRLLMDEPIETCVLAGHAAARVVIQHTGCTFPREPPTFE